MNYDQQITALAAAIKQDKTIEQPWRNKAMARLEEAQAFVRMGQTSSRRVSPGRVDGISTGTTTQPSTGTSSAACICPPGARDFTCPVHTS